MTITTKTQKLMDGTTVVRSLHYLTIKNNKGAELTINVGAKTAQTVEDLLKAENQPELELGNGKKK